MAVATSKIALPGHTQCPDCKQWYEGEGATAYGGIDTRTVCPNCANLAGYLACEDCGKLFPALHDCDGDNYCDDCADSHGFKECSQCNEWMDSDDLEEYNDDLYCESCRDAADLSHCEDCGELFSSDDLTDCDGTWYCEHCKDRNGFTECYYCHETLHRDHCSTGADDNDYCESCWCDHFSVCEDCGNTIWTDDCVYTRDTCYCSDCAPGAENYEPKHFDGSNNTYVKIGKRGFGVEIETDECDGYEDYDGRGAFGAKPDASINGKEFYSDILSGDKGLAEIEAFCHFADRNGFSVDSSCGLHVHFDMRSEDTDSIKAIACAMLPTYEVWKAFVEEGRHSNHYCHASCADLGEVYAVEDFHAWGNRRRRYEWLNFVAYPEHRSLEVRLHHGSLNAQEINNWIRGISLWMDWAASKGWKVVRDSLLYKSYAERFDLMCQVWQDAGCTDLVDWFKSKASDVLAELAEVA
jgi:hypothetical protein